MSDVKFVDGIRAYKPHQKAPDFVKADFQINAEELIKTLETGPEVVRWTLKESKSGTYYLSVNDFKPKQGGDQGGGSAPPASGPPSDDFDDDIPF